MYGDRLLFEMGPIGAIIFVVFFLIEENGPVLGCKRFQLSELFVYRYMLPKSNPLNKLFFRKHTFKTPRIQILAQAYSVALMLFVVLIVFVILSNTIKDEAYTYISFAIAIIIMLVVEIPAAFVSKKAEQCAKEQRNMSTEKVLELREKIKENFPNYFN